MKLFVSLVLLLIGFSFPPQPDIKLEIGAKLDPKYIPKKITQEIMTHPGQMRPFIERSVNRVKYTIAFDAKTREIKYINTDDPKFRTSNGLRVESEIALRREQLDVYPGWEIRAPATSDGWYPVVGVDLPLMGYEMLQNFKEGETKMLTISSFSKGDN